MMKQESESPVGNLQRLGDRLNSEKNKGFPKKIGIVFLGNKVCRQNLIPFLKKRSTRSKLFLDFDEVACAHIVLQMNRIQDLFEFQIVELSHRIKDVHITHGQEGYTVQWFGVDDSTHSKGRPKSKSFTTEDDNYLLQWFEHVISSEIDNNLHFPQSSYWIGITSQSIGRNYFFWTEKIQDKIVTLITSEYWQKNYSPPSVFEYIAIASFRCGLRSLIRDFIEERKHDHEETRGCIFDYTNDKRFRRISISNPNLCSSCKEIMKELKEKTEKSFDAQISRVLTREWLGSFKKENSPIYNLRRNYGYNVDINSGFYKGWFETIRDNIKENSFAWLVTGILGVAFLLLGNFLQILLHLQL